MAKEAYVQSRAYESSFLEKAAANQQLLKANKQQSAKRMLCIRLQQEFVDMDMHYSISDVAKASDYSVKELQCFIDAAKQNEELNRYLEGSMKIKRGKKSYSGIVWQKIIDYANHTCTTESLLVDWFDPDERLSIKNVSQLTTYSVNELKAFVRKAKRDGLEDWIADDAKGHGTARTYSALVWQEIIDNALGNIVECCGAPEIFDPDERLRLSQVVELSDYSKSQIAYFRQKAIKDDGLKAILEEDAEGSTRARTNSALVWQMVIDHGLNYTLVKKGRYLLTIDERQGILNKRSVRKKTVKSEKPYAAKKQLRKNKTKNNTESLDSDDNLIKYLKELKDVPSLTREEENELSKKVMAGDKDAKDALVRSNLRLVVYVAKKYLNYGLDMLDMIQEGNQGLIRAAEKYDYRRGVKFATYAIWWVRQSITRGLSEYGRTIRLPAMKTSLVLRIKRVKQELSQRLGRVATPAEIAQELNMKESNVEEAFIYGEQPVSIEKPVAHEGEDCLEEFIADKDASIDEDVDLHFLRLQLASALMRLPIRQRKILEHRFGLGEEYLTLKQVGEKYGLTRERIRQLQNKAIDYLQEESDLGLRDFWHG